MLWKSPRNFVDTFSQLVSADGDGIKMTLGSGLQLGILINVDHGAMVRGRQGPGSGHTPLGREKSQSQSCGKPNITSLYCYTEDNLDMLYFSFLQNNRCFRKHEVVTRSVMKQFV